MNVSSVLLTYLKPQEIEQITTLLSDIPWFPHPGNKPQCWAFYSPAFELLYGGAAGGGKSDLLAGLARVNHTRSLLLRRTFPDLERSLISRSLEFYGDHKYYNASKHVWNIEGKRIEFGHMERMGTPQLPGDESNYASAPYDLIGFDQLEQFSQYAYEFMFSRARSADKRQRVRMVATANPVGEYLDWIIRRWGAWLDETHPNPAKSGELRYYRRNKEGDEVETDDKDPDGVSRTFIPAGLKDNPYLGDDYRKSLNLLPEPLRSALLFGDFKASIIDDAYQVIPRAWVKDAQARWKPDGKPEGVKQILGVDIARGGNDANAIAPRYGMWFDRVKTKPGIETPTGMENRDFIAAHLVKDGLAAIDVIGVGASVYDLCSEARLKVTPVNFSEKSYATDTTGQLTFINLRAEFYWRFRELLDPSNGRNVALPPDPELLGDLCAPRWSMTTAGIKIEDKEEIKKRLGRSPDKGDAVVIAGSAGSRMLGGIHA